MRVFSLFKKKHVTNLEVFLKSDAITPHLRNRLEALIGSAGHSSLSKAHSRGSDSKDDKMTLEKGYNIDYYPSNNIFEKEKPYRINSRGITLEKMGDSVPLFIRELPSFAKFSKNASFANLSILLNEIFLKGATLATQTYSPTMIDQLSQDQIITYTSDFIIALFKDFLSQKFQVQESKSFEQIFSKILSRNFDYEKEQPMLMGLSFFLFVKLSKIFTENVNYYYIMEKLMGQIFEKVGIIHFEFVIFLCLMKWRERK